jgi:hypothetical protein
MLHIDANRVMWAFLYDLTIMLDLIILEHKQDMCAGEALAITGILCYWIETIVA